MATTGMRCSTCGGELAGRSICPTCGTLVALERTIGHARQRAQSLFSDGLARVPRRLQTHHFLWLCALTPLVIVPPIVSLVSSIALMGRTDQRQRNPDLEWIATISMLNLMLSGLVLYRFHFSATEFLTYGYRSLWDLLHGVMPHVPKPTPNLIPVQQPT
jgi:hypothetical protein